MKINAVLTNRKNHYGNIENQSKVKIVAAVFVVTIILSVLIYTIFSKQLDEGFGKDFVTFFNIFKTKSKPVSFADLLLPYLIFHLVIIISSSSLYGDIIITALISLRISGLTILISHLYTFYRLNGIEYVFLIVMPSKLLYILSLILLTDSGYKTVNYIKNKKGSFMKKNLIGFVVSVIILTISVFIEFISVKSLSVLFNF